MGAEGRIDPAMVADAEALGVDVIAACEDGLKLAIQRAREADWLRENAAAIAEWNGWVDANDLPLSDLHQF